MTNKLDESRIAEEIVSVLPTGVARECSSERGALRYSVRAAGLKLRTIVLNRRSLQKLAADPLRDVKIEYLQRDLLRSATQRAEFCYPRPHVAPAPFPSRKAFSFHLPLVSLA